MFNVRFKKLLFWSSVSPDFDTDTDFECLYFA